MLSIAAALAAYLIGSVSFAIVVSKAMGLNDPRSYGSGNPGATNVLRTGNKKAAVLTLLGDAVKGVIPVVAARLLAPRLGFGDETVAAVALAVFLGHLWPVFFRFQGGKGVATALGVLLALDPWLGLACLATWIAVALIGRISSLAALTAAALSPLYCWLLLPQPIYTFTVTAIAALLILRHRKNIIGLLNGTESRFGKKKDGAA